MAVNVSDYLLNKRPLVSDGHESSPATSSMPHNALRPNALSLKVTSVLAASYADLELREALALLDERSLANSAETRRKLRLEVQKDVMESNGAIIREFGHVAEVLQSFHICILIADLISNSNVLASQS